MSNVAQSCLPNREEDNNSLLCRRGMCGSRRFESMATPSSDVIMTSSPPPPQEAKSLSSSIQSKDEQVGVRMGV